MKASVIWLKLAAVGVAAAIAILGFYSFSARGFRANANSSGPPPGNTGAPPEQTCATCHGDFPVNSGGGSVRITGLPNKYTPGAQYPITVTVNQTNAVVYGFQTTAVNSSGQTAGTFALPTQNPAQMQIVQGIVTVNGQNILRRYVQHTADGVIPTQFNTKSWTFNWTAPATRIGGIRFYASGNGANSDGGPSGDYIYSTLAATCTSSAVSNFDTDNKSDIAVFRPSNGVWYRLNSSDNSFAALQFGAQNDRLVPGDFDGDGKTDHAVYRDGFWYITNSSNNSFAAYQFGVASDVPMVGDFTGDGRSELAVFRSGNWFFWNLANNSFTATNWGTTGDKPVSGDFDGDGRADIAVFRPSNGVWYILNSSNNQLTAVAFGTAGDIAVPGDYDGDGKTDAAVFRPSTATWYLQQSSAGFAARQWGASGDQPAPGDYDGDCQTDIAVFRSGVWYISNSSDSQFRAVQFGSAGDIAVPNAFTAQ